MAHVILILAPDQFIVTDTLLHDKTRHIGSRHILLLRSRSQIKLTLCPRRNHSDPILFTVCSEPTTPHICLEKINHPKICI
jgi:hypothetical protein